VDGAHPVKVDAAVAAEFATMGVQVAIDEMTEGDAFGVWDSNWASLSAFLDCETQRRCEATMAGLHWLGLDYSSVDVVLRRSKAPDEVFDDLRVMETAALAAFGEADL
jgi:Phage related hypothetical protein (DUF1799)